jgi:hypothetical protein
VKITRSAFESALLLSLLTLFLGGSVILAIPQAATAAPTANTSFKWIKKQFRLTNPAPGYSTTIDYPFFTGAGNLQALNAALQATVAKIAGDDQKRYLDYVNDPEMTDGKQAKKQKDGSSIAGSFKVHKTSDNIVSVSFSLTSYFYGIAHPNNFYTTFNYQLNPPATITLSSLTTNKSAFLNSLSKQCATALKHQYPDIDDFSLSDGTAPRESNFQNFLLSDHQIQFLFNDDQVSSHAAAIDKAIGIPYRNLKNLLNPASAVYKMAF